MIRQLGLILVLLLAQPASAAGADPTQECVVLLHGLRRTGSSMKAMEWHLEGAGYAVVNQSYPSLAHSIEELADMAVETGLAHCRSRGTRRIHFVTHSLGGSC
jgi:triacylglycerol lipase